jgi:hypothetical protein
MRQFAHTAPDEVHWWAGFDPSEHGLPVDRLTTHDESAWFGPQFGAADTAGKPRGADVLRWLTTLAEQLGVQVVRGSVVELCREGPEIVGVLVEDESSATSTRRYALRADAYVLAGGSPGGRMFRSTNARIDHSPQELAYRAGLELTRRVVVHVPYPGELRHRRQPANRLHGNRRAEYRRSHGWSRSRSRTVAVVSSGTFCAKVPRSGLASTATIRSPRSDARVAPNPAVTVVFPTPPFKLRTAIL